ncbi:MAG: 1-deoxy-D-xylulose-5-phosphate reductoisomerase [Bacteroidales bacterium]|nr:1-deoxy-D-xylulose-5-phosphate reductoisomerase [Bacteroidales bacterium]MCF8332732.1 1-deoxy-D-xylulose-5-phosphate reductoisomerase [Bacteroidales bacterium]
MRKRIAILGSTGSIGTQTLEVIRQNPDFFQVEVLTAQSNVDLLVQQAREFHPNAVVIGREELFHQVSKELDALNIKVFAGEKSISQIVTMDQIDMVMVALVGFAGLEPTLRAIRNKKPIALANKETLVVAGEMIRKEARQNGVDILPVDSEHSAIFQCLMGEGKSVEKIYLTASGGPFRHKTLEELEQVTKEEALRHPNWDMGDKITIDSATMMNKGLEVIEAHWLFDLAPGQIDIIVHPQSVIHSMVQFEDGSIKAQMGPPDMKVPIQFALAFPHRLKNTFERLDFADYPTLTFEKPDRERFRNIQLAYDALEKGGNRPCVLNAANEIAVNAFLQKKIGFFEISDIIEQCFVRVDFIKSPNFVGYLETDKETRKLAQRLISG